MTSSSFAGNHKQDPIRHHRSHGFERYLCAFEYKHGGQDIHCRARNVEQRGLIQKNHIFYHDIDFRTGSYRNGFGYIEKGRPSDADKL